jgi:N-formylglutamate amidohydrolase
VRWNARSARRIERVLWNDPAIGVVRHADAGYESAIGAARLHGCGSRSRADAAGRAFGRAVSPSARIGVLLVSMPHAGTFVPHSVGRHFDDVAALRPDTDWHLPRLYDFLAELDASVIVATHSRYVIDVNRPADGQNLYPGRDTPLLCPVDTFDCRPLYRKGMEPAREEIERRVQAIWNPYHSRIARELDRIRAAHGVAVLWDAHSIVSQAPRLFEGRLADFNLGTADDASCDPQLSPRSSPRLLDTKTLRRC